MADPLDALRLPVVPIEPRRQFADELLRRIQGAPPVTDVPTVRYFVDNLDSAVEFYRDVFGFEVELRPSPVFAMLYRGDLRLLLSAAGPRGGHVLPDGSIPTPGGWNRLALRVFDLPATVEQLRARQVQFRSDIIATAAIRQVLVLDPAGNPIELYEPATGYHERGTS